MTISNNLYQDVSVIEDVFYVNTYSDYVKTMYYSKSKGIIKYITPDGNVWELIN